MMSTKECPQLPHQEFHHFKIWYSDGTIIRGDSYLDWVNCPGEDVQIVMIYFKLRDPIGRHTRLYSSGCDYYALSPELKLTSSFDDVSKVSGHIKYGRFMNYEKLIELEKLAFEDYD